MDPAYAEQYRLLHEQHFWWRARARLLLDLLDTLNFPRGAEVLDIGCGDGLLFPQLGRYGRVRGVETDVALVTSDNPARHAIHIGPFDASYAPTDRFSLVVMLDVLEHLDQPVDALCHARRLLCDDGVLVVTVPAFKLLWSHHDELNQHRTRYTRPQLEAELRAAGLRTERIHYFFHWMFAAKLASSLRERVLGASTALPGVPPALPNRVAYALCRIEQQLCARRPLPFGSSLLAVARVA